MIRIAKNAILTIVTANLAQPTIRNHTFLRYSTCLVYKLVDSVNGLIVSLSWNACMVGCCHCHGGLHDSFCFPSDGTGKGTLSAA